jgi:hypothetical protein
MILLDLAVQETHALRQFVQKNEMLSGLTHKCNFGVNKDSEAGISRYLVVTVTPGHEDFVEKQLYHFKTSLPVVVKTAVPEKKKSTVPLKYPYVIS